MNKLNKLYEAMLKSWGCGFKEDYSIFLNMAGVEVPVKIEEKQVYLATSENLNGITIGKVFFHPACESIMSKETEVFKVIRKLTSAKIYSTFQPAFEVILSVASKKTAKTVNNKTLEQLEPFKNINKTLKEEIISIIRMISINLEDRGIDTRLINFSMIKGGKTENDETAYWTATPSFPFYTELYRIVNQNSHLKPNDRLTVDTVNVSMQAVMTVIGLFEMVIPACIDPSRKKYSSTSSDAARLVAYLNSYALVAGDLNNLIGKFRKEFDSIGVYGIDIDWITTLDEISEIRSLIPALDYNNYNMSSSPDAPAANGGMRISTYNPLAGIFNGSPQETQSQQSGNQAAVNPPKRPEILHGETYQGVDYSPSSGLYEFKFIQSNGMVRVRCVAEDGRFVTETYVNPMQQQQQQLLNGMVPMTGQMNMNNLQQQLMLQLAQRQIGSGIPMYGMNSGGGQPGMVQDPYSGQWVPANNNNMQPQFNSGMNNAPQFTGGMGGINEHY